MRRTPFIALCTMVLSIALALTACGGTPRDTLVDTAPLSVDETATYEYVIPYGTSVALDAGQSVDLMPARLDAEVGESIRIVNRDARDYMVGPFFVAAGQTVGMRFTQTGTLIGNCDMNAAGEITITIS